MTFPWKVKVWIRDVKHDMFVEVMLHLHDNKWFGGILRPTALFRNKAEQAFLITLCYIVLFL